MKSLLQALLAISLISAVAPDDRAPSAKEAVLKAVERSAGKGFYRHPVEIGVSEENGTMIVLFRRPTSDVIEKEGRLPNKRIWMATFRGTEVETRFLDVEAASPRFDRQYSQESDEEAARAVRTALSAIWKNQKFEDKEFAVNVSEDEGRKIVLMSEIPYTPDAHALLYVYPNGKVEILPP